MTAPPARPAWARTPRRRALATAVATLAAVGVAVVAPGAPPASAAIPAPPAGFSLLWSDDFNGANGTAVSSANWLYDLGTSYPGGAANWGTGEVETMTNSTANVFQDGAGHLTIRPIRSASGAWTSGRIETQRSDFQPAAGGKLRIQASLQQPNVTGAAAAGYWPAFWALGAPFRGNFNNWPIVGEIDMMEDINGLSSEFATLHCGPSIPGTCNETTGLGSGQRACPGCQTGFHTYALEWDKSITPNQLRWYLDGTNFFTLSQNQVDAASWTAATNHGYMIILNLAIGGGFPAAFGGGPTAATVSGVPMLVDYVAVYQAGGGGGGGDTTAPSVPGNLAVTGTTSSSASLSWSASSDNVGVTGYDVFQNGAQVTSVSGTSATVGGLAASTTYQFTVRARDAAGNASNQSGAVSATTAAAGGGGGGGTAYGTLQAESFSSQQGVGVEATTDAGGGQNIAAIANGDWALYRGIDFGATAGRQFVGRVASGAAGGVSGLVEVRLDNRANAPIGSFAVANTGGWQSWRTVPANISAVTGVHDVYLTFTSGQPADFVNVNWFTFGH
jgi:Carbohydrate binding module (family 6)/Glycosyl hydrolases family 16/Fibronectin type III domain